VFRFNPFQISHIHIFPLLFGIAIFLISIADSARATRPDVTQLAICQKSEEAIEQGARWFVRNQNSHGFFPYERYIDEDEDRPTQNLVRQVGSFWAIVRSISVDDTKDKRAAIDHFRDAITAHVVTGASPKGEIAYIDERGIGKLNAAALYLLALLELEDQGFALTPREQEYIPLLANGLTQMRQDSGGFLYLYYVPLPNNRITPYGSAEALLALAKLAHQRNDHELRAYVQDTYYRYYDTYLKDQLTLNSTYLKGYFSWAAQAQPYLGFDEKYFYQNHLRPLAKLALEYRKSNEVCRNNGCIFRNNLCDAPFLEGFMAILPLALSYEDDKAFLDEMSSYADAAIEQIRNRQIMQNSKDILERSPRPNTELIGAFCYDEPCTFARNDFNQHALIPLIALIEQRCLS